MAGIPDMAGMEKPLKRSSLAVREMVAGEVPRMVDYFVEADVDFLHGMGADKQKLPERSAWIAMLEKEFAKPLEQRKFFYLSWLLDGRLVGHSNVNKVVYGQEAYLHLHLWEASLRQKGLGLAFVQQGIPLYFRKLNLQTLICEPYADNPAPNRSLKKLGFQWVKQYETQPGWINFYQLVNRYELRREAVGQHFAGSGEPLTPNP